MNENKSPFMTYSGLDRQYKYGVVRYMGVQPDMPASNSTGMVNIADRLYFIDYDSGEITDKTIGE
ncbi:MAG: hypothetical protein LBD86_06620 [Spirochaetaceae bacterium]|nr:hypothetical protein [Spirochaetaceae bacterium]